MKVVFANNYYYLRGGSERVYFAEIDLLEDRGYEVVPFSRKHPDNRPTTFARYFLPAVAYDELSLPGKLAAAPNIIYSIPTRRRFGSLLDETRPDLIHGHNIYGGLTTSILDEARKRGVPTVITLHDLKLVCPTYLMLRDGEVCDLCRGGAFWQCAAKRCHKDSLPASLVYTVESYFNRLFRKYDQVGAFVCPSRFLADRMLSEGFPAERLVHLPNSLAPADFIPDYTSTQHALFVGRLSEEKGLQTLLDAAGRVDFPIRIAGTGPMDEQARRRTAEQGLDHVTFEGYCTGERLQSLYRDAAFIVLPSQCYENAPMSVLEAFFYGKAVVGSDLGGIPEMVRNEETGLLFQPGDAEDLAGKMRSLWHDAKGRRRLGRAARNLAENDYSHETHYRGLVQIYERLVA